jgi:hypothetical protein
MKMNLKASLSNLLTNKYVLNIVFFVSLLNVIGYVIYRNYDAVIYFILIGLTMAYFSKNMIIILGVPLILVNLFSMGKRKIYEGLQVTSGEKTDVVSASDSNSDSNSDSKSDSKSTSDSASKSDKDKKIEGTEKFEVGRKKGQYNIDYASTIEDAYDDLNKIIGGDGIQRLTEDSQRLMQQQQQLAKAMEGMGPLIEKMAPMLEGAQSMLNSVGGGENLSKVVEGLKKKM